MATEHPRVLKADHQGPVLMGVVESLSRPGQKHFARFLLDGNSLCGCEGSYLGGRTCVHLKALLETMDRDELVSWILESTAKPAA